mmetsp:Transcript_13658/g.24246  ORF Transcript_13658/g.24246 Transcript_13658/m.24246 type:complete len:291 (-) Transcript_13658:9-881(-)
MADLLGDIFFNTAEYSKEREKKVVKPKDVDLYQLAKDADEIENQDTLFGILRQNPDFPIDMRSTTDGRNILHEACVAGHLQLVLKLVREFGADVNHETFLGKDTPLHLAAMHGRRAVCVHLLQHGADPNYRNKYGSTPIFYTRNLTIAIQLVKYGADLNLFNRRRQSVVDAMIGEEDAEDALIDYLLKTKEEQLKEKFQNRLDEVREYEEEVAEIEKTRKRILANRHLRRVEGQARNEYLKWRSGGLAALENFQEIEEREDKVLDELDSLAGSSSALNRSGRVKAAPKLF